MVKVTKNNNVRIIDPNYGSDNVEHEKLFIYTKLTAITKGRSILKNNGLEKTVISETNAKGETNYMYPSGSDKLTTEWTEIGGEAIGLGDDLGGFGVTNIDIDVKSSFVPQVTVNLVDIRGNSLFGQGPCSPYASFFHMPYPTFELIVKGYYGKPVKYTLALRSFNTSFNSQTGNFEIKCEFIGYTYAFLTDMLIGYGLTSTNMPGGDALLSELWEGLKKTNKNPLPKTPINLTTLKKDLETFETIGNENSNEQESNGIGKLQELSTRVKECVGVLDGYLLECRNRNLVITKNTVTEKLGKISYTPYIDNTPRPKEDKSQLNKLNTEYFTQKNSKFYIKYNKDLITQLNANNFKNKVIGRAQFKRKCNTNKKNNNGQQELVTNINTYRYSLNETLSDINKQIIEFKKKQNKKINSQILDKVGYQPTVRNIMTIILTNIEVFLMLLLKSSIEAENIHNNNTNQNVLGNGKENKVYPWPTYKNINNFEQYPKDEKNWAEVRFVENFLNSYVTYKEQEEIISEDFNPDGEVCFNNYIPLNPIESTDYNISRTTNEDGVDLPISYYKKKQLDEIYKEIGLRLFMVCDYSSSYPLSSYINKTPFVINNNIVKKYGTIDGINTCNNIYEDEIKSVISKLKKDELIKNIEYSLGEDFKLMTFTDWVDDEPQPNQTTGDRLKNWYNFETKKVYTYKGNLVLFDKTTINPKKEYSGDPLYVKKTEIDTRKIVLEKKLVNEKSNLESTLIKGTSTITSNLITGPFNNVSENYLRFDNDTLIPSYEDDSEKYSILGSLDDKSMSSIGKVDKNAFGAQPIDDINFGFGYTTNKKKNPGGGSLLINTPLWVYNRVSEQNHKFFYENKIYKTNISGELNDANESKKTLAYIFLSNLGEDDDEGVVPIFKTEKDGETKTNPIFTYVSGKVTTKKNFVLLLGAVLWRLKQSEQGNDPLVFKTQTQEAVVNVDGSSGQGVSNNVGVLNNLKKIKPNEWPIILDKDGDVTSKRFYFIDKTDDKHKYANIEDDLSPIYNLSETNKNYFIEYFESWVNDVWDGSIEYIDPLMYGLEYNDSYNGDDELNTENGNIQKLYNDLTENVDIISSTPYNFSNTTLNSQKKHFNVGDLDFNGYLEEWLDGFKNTYKSEQKKPGTNEKKEEKGLSSAVNDDDIKLSLYRSFKAIYDKWVSTSSNGSGSDFELFYNKNSSGSGNRRLIEHFNFVDRGFNDIGDECMLDLSQIKSTVFKDTNSSVYQVVTNILRKSNFDFFPLPNFIPYGSLNNDEIKEMFEPTDSFESVDSSPSFVCMFNGGTSKSLNLNNSVLGSRCVNNKIKYEYSDDGFSFIDNNLSETSLNNAKDVTSFLVSFGDENQSHFKSVSLDQAEFRETQESLMVIDRLANGNNESQSGRVSKGQNLYDVYQTRSYKCKVESLGNMMIQPMTYFELVNVPMFKGAYLITEVSHNIEPNNVSTTFTGVRVPRVSIPLVTEPYAFMEITDSEYDENTRNNVKNKTNTRNNYPSDFNLSETKSNDEGGGIIIKE